MQHQHYTAANRAAWNEAAPIHRKSQFAALLDRFRQPGYSCLDEIETAILQRIELDGKAVAQLCCNNGREILSVKNLGAERCVGFDIAEAFIAQARELAAVGGIRCEFVVSDVYGVPAAYDAQFDLVTVTIGALGWMPDAAGFFAVAARLLRADGHLFIYEQHPVFDMFEPDEPDSPLTPRYSYFVTEPFRDEDGLDYWEHRPYKSKPKFWFHRKLSDIFGACLGNGFAIETFEEYDHDLSGGFAKLAELPTRLPMSYSLVARKAG